jgi:hypothetical protein
LSGFLMFIFAGAVTGLVGAQTAMGLWIMGIAAQQPVLSVTNLSFGRRIAIWLTAMTAGVMAVGLAIVAIILLMQITAPYMLTGVRGDRTGGRVTNVFHAVVAISLAIRWAPVAIAWSISKGLVNRSVRLRQVVSPSPMT